MSNREFGDGYGTIKDYELSPTGSAYEGEEGTARGYQADDYVQFQSLSDTISGNIFQINSNVQALERISKQLGNQLKEMPYDKLHRIQQGTNRLATETAICYKRLLNLSIYLSTPQVAKVTGIDSQETSNSRTSSTPFSTTNNPLSKHSDKFLFGDMDNTILRTCLPAGFTPKALPTSLSPGEKTSKTSGEMKTAPRGATHYSLKNNAEDDEIVNPLPEILHAVPLPMKTAKNMSSFFFTSNKAAETSMSPKESESHNKPLEANTARDKTAAESTKNGFIFSNPTRKLPIVSVNEALARANEEVSFMFSQPVSVKAKKDKIQNTVTESVKDILKNSPFTSKSPNQGVGTISSTVISSNERTVSSATQNSLAKMFAPAPGEWSCSSCMLRNKAADLKCVACGTAGASKTSSEQSKNNTNEATKIPSNGIDLAKKFAPKEGTWKCEICMINNEALAVTCVACSSAKPSTEKSRSSDFEMNKGQSMDLRIKFAPPANTWSCETCMVRNKIDDTKCVACLTAKPGATATEIYLKKKFAAPGDSWNCETCMITNQSSEVKGVACQTNKPGTETGASSSSSGSGFTFGDGARSTSAAPSFTFGNAVPETPKSGFTFGLSSTKEENTTPEFIFGASGGSGSDSKNTGFTFAFSDKESTSKNVTEKENEKEISIVKENLNKVAKPEVRGNTSGLFGSSGTPGTSGTGGFNFGSAGSTNIPSAFQFGTSSNNNANTPSGGFNFGASAVAPGGGSPFVFGATSTNATSAPANSSTPSAGFAFNPAANTPTFAVGQTNPGGFNVGATSTQPRVFKKALRRARR